jgi:hypothetical protein
MTKGRAHLVMLALTLGLLAPALATAQSAPSPPTGDTRTQLGQPIVVHFPDGATLTLNPNGSVKGVVPGFQVDGRSSGSSSGGSSNPGPSPLPNPVFQPVDLEALDAAIRFSNATRCLTQMGFLCAPVPPALGGRLNEHSTRADMNWLVNQIGHELDGDAPLPAIQVRANPDPGITGIPTWFWVDPATYGGQTFTASASVPVGWTLYWDEIIHHHDVSSAPCSDDPSQQCTTTHDWDETVTHHEEHQDWITVTVEFSPAQFAWDFGDDLVARRDDSHASFDTLKGMGQPYINPHTPSPVAHNYRESSFKVFDQGGFPIQLSVTWSATATWHFTSDLGDNISGTRTFGARANQYTLRHQVRESQPVLVATSR